MLIPTPKWKEEDDVYIPSPTSDSANNARIKEFLNVRPWICSCRLTNFGGNKLCADWRCKKPRPADFVEQRRAE